MSLGLESRSSVWIYLLVNLGVVVNAHVLKHAKWNSPPGIFCLLRSNEKIVLQDPISPVIVYKTGSLALAMHDACYVIFPIGNYLSHHV